VRFGTFTSPHIFRFNERISVMGEPVSDACLVRAFEHVEKLRGDISLTYFEFTTLAGLLILQQAKLDCAVLEVGLGGRLDTVNLVDADCAVITPIGLDHQEYLGPDLSSIATEKAGILRQGKPVVCTQASPPEEILKIAGSLQAPVYRRGVEFELSERSGSIESPLLFTMGNMSLRVPRPGMGGPHQLDNLAAAMAALVLMRSECLLKANEMATAIRDCQVPGRLQKVNVTPEILLDVGHNELAAAAIAAFLRENNRPDTICVLAMFADKSAEAVAREMGEVCQHWLCADSPGPRGQTGTQLASRIGAALPNAKVGDFNSVEQALRSAVSLAVNDETILVFGSFTTVSAAAVWIKNSLQRDRHDAAKLT
ncbi:MAG: bifunctional folylpolyglutamate synthase/dihydrofolate synthase, partial [Gammaproteobacteria bacterium]|nr:bifunctional folylpolyglutamate synthase/dihydrofolate synthase [Gammaproteobacteria bacterium]